MDEARLGGTASGILGHVGPTHLTRELESAPSAPSAEQRSTGQGSHSASTLSPEPFHMSSGSLEASQKLPLRILTQQLERQKTCLTLGHGRLSWPSPFSPLSAVQLFIGFPFPFFPLTSIKGISVLPGKLLLQLNSCSRFFLLLLLVVFVLFGARY